MKNRYYSDGGSDYVISRLSEEFAFSGISVEVSDVFSLLESSRLPDFAVMWDKDVSGARMLERRGVRLFNRADSVRICDDKYLTYAETYGICDYPETFCAPLEYSLSPQFDEEFSDRVSALGFPLVAKPAVGSLGSGVTVINDFDALKKFCLENSGKRRIMYQSFVKSSEGRDTRLYVIGGKTVAAVKRVNEHSFKSNAEAGASTYLYDAPSDMVRIAERLCMHLKLDYASVDFFDCEKPLLNEINSNAYFHGAETACGVNIARRYVGYIAEVMKC